MERLEPRVLLDATNLALDDYLFGPSEKVAGSHGTDIAVEDFDGDGNLDIASVGREASGWLIINYGDGHGGFPRRDSIAAGAYPADLATADFNLDGQLDLAVRTITNDGKGDSTVTVFLRETTGGFTAHTPVDTPEAQYTGDLIAGDMNGDGRPDVVVSTGCYAPTSTVSVLYAQSDGSLANRLDLTVGEAPTALATGDFNDDGRADLAVGLNGDRQVAFLYGQEGGDLGDRRNFDANGRPTAIATGDFDRDGRTDLAMTYRDDRVHVLFGQADGDFGEYREYVIAEGADTIIAADLNADGVLDLAVPNSGLYDDNLGVLYGRPDGSFSHCLFFNVDSGVNGSGLAAGDVTGDGKVDLLVGGSGTTSILSRTDEGAVFQTACTIPIPDEFETPWKAVTGDFNGDTRPDVATYANGYIDVYYGSDAGLDAPTHSATNAEWQRNGLLAADLNNDGRDDLAYFREGEIAWLYGQADGSFDVGGNVTGSGNHLVAGDFNGDGSLDLGLVNDNTFIAYYQEDGVFTPVSTFDLEYGPRQLAVGDFDGDGRDDIVALCHRWRPPCATREVNLFIWRGQSNRRFTHSGWTCWDGDGVAIAAADLNGDGRSEIAVADMGNSDIRTFTYCNGFSQERRVTVPIGFGDYADGLIATADFNGDGGMDLVVGLGVEDDIYAANFAALLTSQADGDLRLEQRFSLNHRTIFLAAADVNIDGKPDLLTFDQHEEDFLIFPNGCEDCVLDELSAGIVGVDDIRSWPGMPIHAMAEVRNEGLGDLISCNVVLYVSPDAAITEDDDILTQYRLDSLLAGEAASREVTFLAPETLGTYYMAFKAGQSWGATTQLTVAEDEDAYEENDELAAAFDLSNYRGEWLSDIAGRGVQGDWDYYRIEATDDATRIIADCRFAYASPTISVQTMTVYLCDDSGRGAELASTNGVWWTTLDHVVPAAGTYYLLVDGAGRGNSYDLRWNAIAPDAPDDPYEQSDDSPICAESAMLLGWPWSDWPDPTPQQRADTIRQRLSDISGPAIQADPDWYAFDETFTNQRLHVECDFTHAEGDINLVLVDGLGTILDISESDTDGECLDVLITDETECYLLVEGDCRGNEYDLSWARAPFAPEFEDPYESNDFPWEATGLTPGVRLSTLNGPALSGDTDWYRIDVDHAGRLLVNRECMDWPSPLYLLDQNLTILAKAGGSFATDAGTIDIRVSAGTYYLWNDGDPDLDDYDRRYDLWVNLPKPDIRMSAEGEWSQLPGQVVTIDFWVRNDWDDFTMPAETTPPGETWSVAAYLSPDPFVDDSDMRVAEVLFTTLASGSTWRGEISFQAPTALGTYYVGVLADDGDLVAERDETNNWSDSVVVLEVQQADLIAWIDDPSALTASQGQQLQLPIGVLNQGNRESSTSIVTQIYLSNDPQVDTSDTPVGDEVEYAFADPGVTERSTVCFAAPLAVGVYYLAACADHADRIDEFDETNNWSNVVMLEVTPFHTHVLSVGVCHPDTNLAGNIAAQQVSDAFAGYDGVETNELLTLTTDDSDNRQALETAIAAAAGRVLPGDTFVFYLASRGYHLLSGDEAPVSAQWIATDPDARHETTGDEYIVLEADGDGTMRGISDDDLSELFLGAPWQDVNKLFILDACYAGGFAGSTEFGDTGDLSRLPKTALITSAAEGDFAYAVYDESSDQYVPVLGTALAETLATLQNEPTIGVEDLFQGLEQMGGLYDNQVGRVLDFQDNWGADALVDYNPSVKETADFAGRIGELTFLPLDSRRPVVLPDADGDRVTISLKGGGDGGVLAPSTGAADPVAIVLNENTTSHTSLTICVKQTSDGLGATGLERISILGSVGKLTLQNVRLTGSLDVAGRIDRLNLGEVCDTTITLHTDRAIPVNAKHGVAITLGVVSDVSIDTGGVPIKSLRATDWTEGDSTAKDTVTAPRIGSVSTSGHKENRRVSGDQFLAGDWAADLVVDPTTATPLGKASKALGRANIKGEILADLWDIQGPSGAVKCAQWLEGTLRAETLKGITTTGLKVPGARGVLGGDWGADIAITGSDNPKIKVAMGGSKIIGNLTGGLWDIVGAMGNLKVAGFVRNTTVHTTQSMGAMRFGASEGSDFLAGVTCAAAGDPTVLRRANHADDFTNKCAIKSVKITGIKNQETSSVFFADSNFSAWNIGKVHLVNADYDAGQPGVSADEVFGFWAASILSVKHKDLLDRTNCWTWIKKTSTSVAELSIELFDRNL